MNCECSLDYFFRASTGIVFKLTLIMALFSINTGTKRDIKIKYSLIKYRNIKTTSVYIVYTKIMASFIIKSKDTRIKSFFFDDNIIILSNIIFM